MGIDLESTPMESIERTKFYGTDVYRFRIFGVSHTDTQQIVYDIGGGDNRENLTETKCCGKTGVRISLDVGFFTPDGLVTSGDEMIVCCILTIVLIVLMAFVWLIVLIVFSIFTFGGFWRRRFRMHLLVENPTPQFLSKVALAVALRGGIMAYDLGVPEYDDWKNRVLRFYKRLMYVRQIAIGIGTLWGFVEVIFKVADLINPSFDYNLWPFRIIMGILFLPLIIASFVIEFRLRGLYHDAVLMLDSMVTSNTDFDPSIPVSTPMASSDSTLNGVSDEDEFFAVKDDDS